MSEKPTGEGIGQALPRKEDLRFLTRPRALRRRHRHAEHGLCRDGAHARTRMRASVPSTRAAAKTVARRGRGLYRRRLGRRRPQADPAWRLLDRPARRRADASGPTTRSSARRNCRCPDKIVHCVGEPVAMVIAETDDASEGRGRAGRGRLRGACRRSCVRARCGEAGRAARLGRAPRQHRARWRGRRQGDDRRGLRQGRACRANSTPGSSASPARRWSRAPRSAIHRRSKGRYTIYAGTGGGIVRERADAGRRARRAGRAMPRAVRRHGRQFRHAQHLLPGICGCCPGRRSSIGRPVKWHGRPQRMLPQRLPGPRPDRRGRARARQGRQFPRRARHQSQQCRRAIPRISRRCARASASCRASIDIPAVHFRGCAVLTNTVADDALSQRRPARGDLRDRAADRSRRASNAASIRSSCGARNLIPPNALPYTNGVGITYDNGEYEKGMDAALRARRLARASPRARRNRRRAASCAASASPITSRAPAASPRERAEVTVAPAGPRRAGARHDEQRPGPRDQLRAAPHRMARRAVRERRFRRARHRSRAAPAAARIPAARCGSPASRSAPPPT